MCHSTGGYAVCGGAECPEPAPCVCARGCGVDAGAKSDHQGSHGPVVTSADAVGKAEQAGFLQGVGILHGESTDCFPRCFLQMDPVLQRNDLPPCFGILPSPYILLERPYHLGVFIRNIIAIYSKVFQML